MFEMERKHQFILLFIAALVLFGAGYKYAQVRGAPLEESGLVTEIDAGGAGQNGSGEEKDREPQDIMVHVAGEVQRPGVYRLAAGSRVVDAVNMAGPTEYSALDCLNLAAPLQDGGQIMVYSTGDFNNQASLPNSVSGDAGFPLPVQQPAGFGGMSGLVNINTAGQAELEQLPGIGPALAQRIIDHRTKNGRFLSPKDIMAVSGIGEKRYEQLKDLITVN